MKKYLKNPRAILAILATGLFCATFICSSKIYDITNLKNISYWVSSFLTTYVVFIVMRLISSKIKILRSKDYLIEILSFFISTIIGGSIIYTFDNFNIVQFIINFIFGIVVFLGSFIIGFFFLNRAKQDSLKAKYLSLFEKMPLEDKENFIKYIKSIVNNENAAKCLFQINDIKIYKDILNELCKKYK